MLRYSAVLERTLVNELRALDLRKVVGEHKVGVLGELDCARIIEDEGYELRASVFVFSLDRNTEFHSGRAEKAVGRAFFIFSEISDKLLCLLVALVGHVKGVHCAGNVGVSGKNVGMYVFGDEACEHRQIYMTSCVAVEVIGAGIERERGVRKVSLCGCAYKSRGNCIRAREQDVHFFHSRISFPCAFCECLVYFILPQKAQTVKVFIVFIHNVI